MRPRLTTTRQVADEALYRSSISVGGGGITQLTGQVTAGPGAGVQAAIVAAQEGNIFYIDPMGSDVTGNGNEFNPFATYWSGTAPANVADALDRIAAKVGPIP